MRFCCHKKSFLKIMSSDEAPPASSLPASSSAPPSPNAGSSHDVEMATGHLIPSPIWTPSPSIPPMSQKNLAPMEDEASIEQPILFDPSSTPTAASNTSPPPSSPSNHIAKFSPTTSINNQVLPPPSFDEFAPIPPAVSASPSSGDTEGVMELDSAIAEMESHAPSSELALAKTTSCNSTAYAARKKRLIVEFIEALKKKSPTYDKFLVRTLNVPNYFRVKEIESVFTMLGGQENKRKKIEVLNSMLIDWIGSKRKNNGGFHSPATINSQMRCFFAGTKDEFNWNYTPKSVN